MAASDKSMALLAHVRGAWAGLSCAATGMGV
jgi:hypothetical protein